MNSKKEITINSILIGDYRSGKTAFFNRVIRNRFNDEYLQTFESNFSSCSYNYESSKIKLNIWDTPGIKYNSAKMYFQISQICLLFYDITNRVSFENTGFYIDNFKVYCPDAEIVALGNKCDLENEREVTFDEAKRFFDQESVQFWEISCKTKGIIKETLQLIALKSL